MTETLLYRQAEVWARKRRSFARSTFQRGLRVGFVTRDQLLLELTDAGVIRRTARDTFEVIA